MADLNEEFEPLFDYKRVQPPNLVCLDDDEFDMAPDLSPKRRKVSNSVVEKVDKNGKEVFVLDEDDEEKENEDWLSSPPKVSCEARVLAENSTIRELRLKKQELVSFAQSAADLLRDMEESAKREIGKSLEYSLEAVADEPLKLQVERAKIVIAIQDKDGLKHFRIFADDKFGRLFKLYGDKVQLEPQNLVFCFDGEKLGADATPEAHGIENNDIVEVHVKSS